MTALSFDEACKHICGLDRNLMTALSLLMKLINTFGPVIHTTRTSAPSLGVDLQAEQRYHMRSLCYTHCSFMVMDHLMERI
jgi:hypothetical protein